MFDLENSCCRRCKSTTGIGGFYHKSCDRTVNTTYKRSQGGSSKSVHISDTFEPGYRAESVPAGSRNGLDFTNRSNPVNVSDNTLGQDYLNGHSYANRSVHFKCNCYPNRTNDMKDLGKAFPKDNRCNRSRSQSEVNTLTSCCWYPNRSDKTGDNNMASAHFAGDNSYVNNNAYVNGNSCLQSLVGTKCYPNNNCSASKNVCCSANGDGYYCNCSRARHSHYREEKFSNRVPPAFLCKQDEPPQKRKRSASARSCRCQSKLLPMECYISKESVKRLCNDSHSKTKSCCPKCCCPASKPLRSQHSPMSDSGSKSNGGLRTPSRKGSRSVPSRLSPIRASNGSAATARLGSKKSSRNNSTTSAKTLSGNKGENKIHASSGFNSVGKGAASMSEESQNKRDSLVNKQNDGVSLRTITNDSSLRSDGTLNMDSSKEYETADEAIEGREKPVYRQNLEIQNKDKQDMPGQQKKQEDGRPDGQLRDTPEYQRLNCKKMYCLPYCNRIRCCVLPQCCLQNSNTTTTTSEASDTNQIVDTEAGHNVEDYNSLTEESNQGESSGSKNVNQPLQGKGQDPNQQQDQIPVQSSCQNNICCYPWYLCGRYAIQPPPSAMYQSYRHCCCHRHYPFCLTTAAQMQERQDQQRLLVQRCPAPCNCFDQMNQNYTQYTGHAADRQLRQPDFSNASSTIRTRDTSANMSQSQRNVGGQVIPRSTPTYPVNAMRSSYKLQTPFMRWQKMHSHTHGAKSQLPYTANRNPYF